MADYPDALTCDLAEVYGIYDWRELPVKTVAILSAGLPDDCRVKRAATGQPGELKTMLLATIADRLSILIWQNTKAAQKGKNKPRMILDSLTKQEERTQAFATATEFEAARQRFFTR